MLFNVDDFCHFLLFVTYYTSINIVRIIYIYCHLLLLTPYVPLHAPSRLSLRGYTPVELLIPLVIDFVHMLYARDQQRHMILMLTCAFVIILDF